MMADNGGGVMKMRGRMMMIIVMAMMMIMMSYCDINVVLEIPVLTLHMHHRSC